MENTQRVWIMHIIVFSFNFLTVKELSTERHFIVWAIKLNHQVYYKGILTSKFGSKDMLLWKRSFSFVSTEDENLCNPSRPTWFDRPRAPKRLPRTTHKKITAPNFCLR